MLDKTGFDLWADSYDQSVGLSDETNTYPFAGYKQVLGRIYARCLGREAPRVLDIGFGTGVLTARLYEAGCRIYGQDLSPRMLKLARPKMPGAELYCGDFTLGLCPELLSRRYDFIVSTYALHHLTDSQKPPFIRSLLEILETGGELLIGDVAFRDRARLEMCREREGDGWDDGEFYFVYEEMLAHFPALRFEEISFCAGVLSLTKSQASPAP